MSVVAAPPVSPFKGLAAYDDSELDALFFFGREREREVLVANLLASRLTVLFGESGVGKTSLLAAGVARELRALGSGTVVVVHDTWSEPFDGLFDAVREAPEAYLILDQLEEYFLYHGDEDHPGTLLHELPELLRESRVNVLVSLREDALAQLDAFKARIPAVFANQVRLEHLDRAAARAAILGPIGRWNELTGDSVEIEPALVEAVLDEVAVEGRSHDREQIEAPYLQLVLERIWETERPAGSSLLRLETLRALGGARTIVRDHLLRALEGLAVDEQDVAASMFEHLVTPSGTKIAHRAPDLAQYADVPEDLLRRVLSTLTQDRIVHSVDGTDRYEIFHDVLAEPISAWRQQRRLERERAAAGRRQRRLVALTVVSLFALAVVAGLAVWAFSERGSARSQARHARARELDATALQQLSVDPNQSVRLALAATRLEPGRATEGVLREALISDRLRLVKHTSVPVRAVATSPRGDLVAAAVAGRRVLLLDAHNRRLVRTITAPGAVTGLAFAADGRRLVTTSPQGLAAVWDVGTGRRLAENGRVAGARTPDGRLQIVALHGRLAQMISHFRRLSAAPGGQVLAAAVADPDGRVHTWLFDRSGRLLRVLPQKGVKDIVFSPDGRLLATAGADGFTILWDVSTGRRVRSLADAKSGVNVAAFSPDGSLLATGGEDSGVRIWTVATGERKYFLFGHTNPVTTLAWSPDGRVVASGSPDRTALLWRLQGLVGAGSLAATLAGSAGPVRALAFSADGTQLVTGGDDATVRIWDARPDQPLDLLGRAPGPALAARWSGSTIVGLWRSVVKTYDARTRHVTHVFHGDSDTKFTSLGVSSDGSVIAAGSTDGTTSVWNGRTGDRVSAHAGPATVSAVAVSPRGDLVASGDSRGIVRVWSHGKRLLWSARQTGRVVDVAFSPRGDMLVTSGSGGAVVWSAAGGRRLHDLASPGGVADSVFSPDERLVATAGGDANGRLWFVRTGRLHRVLRGHTKPLTAVAFSRDGLLLATSSRDSDARVWSIRTGVGHVLQRSAFGPVSTVGFDPTGRWVAAAGPISVIVWTTSTGRQLFYLRGHTSLVTGLSLAPHAATVLSSSRDGTLRTYNCDVCVDLATLVHLAEVRLARTR